MLSNRTLRQSGPGGRVRRHAGTTLACGVAVLAAGLGTGCAAQATQAAPAIQLSSAQVSQPGSNGVTDIYVDVRNNGPADRIIGARLSVGGHVTLRSPVHTGEVQMRTVSSIVIPADSFVGLDPNGPHVLVTDPGKMISGREVTVTLLFAHAGAVSAAAMVTNPATGGASYFLN